jgi:DNA-binding ferritin-like protein
MTFEDTLHGGNENVVAPSRRNDNSVRLGARCATERGDDGTIDLLVSDALRTNEKQAWFVHQLLATSDANGKG